MLSNSNLPEVSEYVLLVLLHAASDVDASLISQLPYSKGKEKAKASSASPSPLPAEAINVETQAEEELIAWSHSDEESYVVSFLCIVFCLYVLQCGCCSIG